MKKIYATLLMLLVGIVAFAQDKTITIVCDNYEFLNVFPQGKDSQEDIIPWNTETKSLQLTIPGNSYGYSHIVAKDGYIIRSICNSKGEDLLRGREMVDYGLSPFDVKDGETLTVTVAQKLPQVAYIQANPDEVYLQFDGKKYGADDQTDGQWKIEVPEDAYGSIYVYAKDGYVLTKAYNNTTKTDYLNNSFGELAYISVAYISYQDNFIVVEAVEKQPTVAYIKGDPKAIYIIDGFNTKELGAEDQTDGQWKIEVPEESYGSISVCAFDGFSMHQFITKPQMIRFLKTAQQRDKTYIPILSSPGITILR